jgi:hypothetical protein
MKRHLKITSALGMEISLRFASWLLFRLAPHSFHKNIDALSGCLYPQRRHRFPPPLREAFKQLTLQRSQNPPWLPQ